MTPQQVIKAFMAKLNTHGYDNSNGDVATKMLDAAIRASSRFDGIQDAIDKFTAAQKQTERDVIKDVLTTAGKWNSSYEGKQLNELESTINSLIDVSTLDSNAKYDEWNDSRSTAANVIRERTP